MDLDFLQNMPLTTADPITPAEKEQAMVDVFGPEFAGRFGDPIMYVRLRQYSQPCKQFYRRDFALLSRSLWLESVYRRRRDFSTDVLDRFASLTAQKNEDVSKMLRLNVDRFIKLAVQSGMPGSDLASFMRPSDQVVPIIATGSRFYIKNLELLDYIMALTGSLMLWGSFDSKQRTEAEALARKAIRAYGMLVRVESSRLYKESQRMQSALAQVAPGVVDSETVGAEAAHKEAAERYDREVAQEAVVDPHGHVEGESAADLISNMAATAIAADAASKKPRRPRGDRPGAPETAVVEPAGAAAS